MNNKKRNVASQGLMRSCSSVWEFLTKNILKMKLKCISRPSCTPSSPVNMLCMFVFNAVNDVCKKKEIV